MRKRSRYMCSLLLILSMVLLAVSCSVVDKVSSTEKESSSPVAAKAEAASLITEGNAYLEAGDVNKATALFNKALQKDPGNAEATAQLQQAEDKKQQLISKYLNNGIKYFTQNALEDAMKEWDKILALDPNHEEALDYKAQTQERIDAFN